MNTIDLNYRPDTYWPESLTPEQLLSRIHGKERQDIACLTYAACGFSGLDAFLAREALTHEEREAWGRVHPLCMGGEYLPDTEAGEVEIARLSMQSTTGDQISMRARQADGVIRYRVVGEYEDEEGMRYVLPFEVASVLPQGALPDLRPAQGPLPRRAAPAAPLWPWLVG
ncbi:MAG: hypothetical protein ACE1Y4_07675, partial [Lysobacterales bacterium]